MSEIKFRALVQYPRKDPMWIYYPPLTIPHAFYAQNDDNVDNRATIIVKNLRFTGLTDKNGDVEIYEGDIIDEVGNVKGNIYENIEIYKTGVDCIVEGFCTKNWRDTEEEILKRGCKYAE